MSNSWISIAAEQAALCEAVYGGASAVKSLASENYGTARMYSVGHITAAAIEYSNRVHLSVCGTDELDDVIQDFQARQVVRNGLTVHQGFGIAADDMMQVLEKGGFAEFADGKPLVFGGHSAGGAIANILTTYGSNYRYNIHSLYTFGAPRCYSPESARLNRTCGKSRFVMPGDPIPRTPLRLFRKLYGGARYAHDTSAIVIRDDGEISTDVGPWQKFKDFFADRFTFAAFAEAHSMKRYSQAVQLAADIAQVLEPETEAAQ